MVSGILLILSVIDCALAAPVLAQKKHQACVDVMHIPKDVVTVFGKRGSEELEKLLDKSFKAMGKPAESSDAHASSSSTPPGPNHGSTSVVQAPTLNPASSTANPNPLMELSSPSSTPSSEGTLSDSEDYEWLYELEDVQAPVPNPALSDAAHASSSSASNPASSTAHPSTLTKPSSPSSTASFEATLSDPEDFERLYKPDDSEVMAHASQTNSKKRPWTDPDPEPPWPDDNWWKSFWNRVLPKPGSRPADGWTDVTQPLSPIPEEPSPVSSPDHVPPNPGSLTETGNELMKGDSPPGPSGQASSTMSSADNELMGAHALPNPGPSTESDNEMMSVPLSSPVSSTNPDP